MTSYSGPAGGTTAVDLSRLPFPALIEVVSYDDIMAGAKAMLLELVPENVRPDVAAVLNDESELLVKLMRVFAYREMNVRQRINDTAKARMLAYAQGSDLDHAALPYAVRQTLVPADPDTGAPAIMEDDDSLRERAMLGPEGYSVAGPAGAYVKFAREADPRVKDASCTSPDKGEILITVLSRLDGGVPGPDLLAIVEQACSDESVRPLTDYVQVQAVQIQPFTVEATLKTFAGPDSAVVMAEARRRLDVYLENSYRLGRDITRAAVTAALCPDGVQDVDLISPAASLVITPLQAARCDGVTLTHAGLAE